MCGAALRALALVSFGIGATVLCDSADKSQVFYAAVDSYAKSLKEKRFADLDKRLNTVLDDVEAGRIVRSEPTGSPRFAIRRSETRAIKRRP